MDTVCGSPLCGAGFSPPRNAKLADNNFTAPSAQLLFVTVQRHGSRPGAEEYSWSSAWKYSRLKPAAG